MTSVLKNIVSARRGTGLRNLTLNPLDGPTPPHTAVVLSGEAVRARAGTGVQRVLRHLGRNGPFWH